VLEEARKSELPPEEPSDWLRAWYAPQALTELLSYRAVAAEQLDDPGWDVAKVILSRAARSARLTTHFDLDFPRHPQVGEYFCHKHKRICRPVSEARKFLSRYTTDTVKRLREFAQFRTQRHVEVLHGDARDVQLPVTPTTVITSPPYPGLIDYHHQHRYAYELLGLEDRGLDEVGAASFGTSKTALAAYSESIVAVLRNTVAQCRERSPIIIIVNDSRNLYPEILAGANLRVEEALTRHVNRRTGRRAGEFFESVLVCRPT
jgi:hypothetical protein